MQDNPILELSCNIVYKEKLTAWGCYEMKTTNDFLDELKTRQGLASDYALAKFLGFDPSRICHYRKKRSFLEDDYAVLIAELLEIDPAFVLANIHAERAKDEVTKRVWSDLVKKLGGVAAALIIAVLTIQPQPAYALEMTSAFNNNIHYTKYKNNSIYAHILKIIFISCITLCNSFTRIYSTSPKSGLSAYP